MKTAGPKKLVFSREQLEEHLTRHYTAHTAKLKEIEARVHRAGTACPDDTYCSLRSLKKEQVYAANSVRLHHTYFAGLVGGKTAQPPEIRSALARDFGSEQEWEEQFLALGMCSRGWAVLGFDLNRGRLCNFLADFHSEGVWSVLPLLVLDVCEHAYCRDFPARRTYIEAFISGVNWRAVHEKFCAAEEIYNRYGELFKLTLEEVFLMSKWVCNVCGYVYDPDDGTPPGTPFEELPEEWVCPVCGAGKDEFEKED